MILCQSAKRVQEGLAEADQAIALDPLSPLPSWTREFCLVAAHRYDEAIAQHKKTQDLDRNFFYADSYSGIAYRQKGMLNESLAEYRRASQIAGQPLPGMAVTFARMGRSAEARAILREILDLSTRRYVAPEAAAIIYIALGEKDQAFVWLDKALEARSASLVYFIGMPQYDPVRADPRFVALLGKIKPPR